MRLPIHHGHVTPKLNVNGLMVTSTRKKVYDDKGDNPTRTSPPKG